jgi:hypothetical protein
MRSIRVPVDEGLMHEIRVRAAQARLTRKEWVRLALEQAARETAEQKQPEEAHVD